MKKLIIASQHGDFESRKEAFDRICNRVPATSCTQLRESTNDGELSVKYLFPDRIYMEYRVTGDNIFEVSNAVQSAYETYVSKLQSILAPYEYDPSSNYKEDKSASLNKVSSNKDLLNLCKECAAEIVVTENTNSVHDMYYDLNTVIEDAGYTLTETQKDKIHDWIANGKLDQYFNFTY